MSMMINENSILERSTQTTLTLPIALYLQLKDKAKSNNFSLSQVVRNALEDYFKNGDLGADHERTHR